MVIVQVELLVSTSVATAMSTVSAVAAVTSVMGTDAESVVLIIASVEVFLAELGMVMRAVLVSVSIAVLVVG